MDGENFDRRRVLSVLEAVQQLTRRVLFASLLSSPLCVDSFPVRSKWEQLQQQGLGNLAFTTEVPQELLMPCPTQNEAGSLASSSAAPCSSAAAAAVNEFLANEDAVFTGEFFCSATLRSIPCVVCHSRRHSRQQDSERRSSALSWCARHTLTFDDSSSAQFNGKVSHLLTAP